MRLSTALHRRARSRMFVQAMASADHPILAQIIPIRRCNLACTYCNEFDKYSPPVHTDEMLRRIDKLGDLGTSIITFSGGEPTLHPDLDRLDRASSPARRNRDSYYEWLSADTRSHQTSECRRSGLSSNQHR